MRRSFRIASVQSVDPAFQPLEFRVIITISSLRSTPMAIRVHILLLLLLCWSWPGPAQSIQPSRFFFPNFVPDSNSHVGLTTVGSSFVLYGQLQLTPDDEMTPAPLAVGKAFYAERIRMLDPVTRQAASFSTYFTFSINNLSCARQLCGDGIAFLISPDDHSLGEYGGNLGIYNSTSSLTNTLAVEFDTYRNLAPINDIDDNHVGINVENATSRVAVSASSVDINLKDGSELTAWIDYDGGEQSLQVRVGRNSSEKPLNPLIDYALNLTEVVNEFMYIGFSAATGNYYELHTIYSWSFNSQAKEPLNTPPADNLVPNSTDGAPDSQAPITSPPDSSSSSSSTSRVLRGIVVGLPIGVGAMIIICAFFLLGKRRKLWILPKTGQESVDSAALYGPESFRYKQLSVATQGFSDKERLGNGMGDFYRGVLASTGAVVAVKRVPDLHSKAEKEMYAELSVLTEVRHRNLAQLLGWCRDRGGKYILVYEFIPQGSLSKALYPDPEAGGEPLSWAQRVNIITSLAEALNYLHGGYHQQVVHRNVKPSSILLDDQFNTKLGDYGLVEEQTKRKSDAVSLGYTAPEVFDTGKGSIKADVFAFGAVALEVVCGRRPIEGASPAGGVFGVDWLWELLRRGEITSAVDNRLGGQFVAVQAQAILVTGLLCSQTDPDQRPSMRQVLKYLAGDKPILPAAIQVSNSSLQPSLNASTSSGKSRSARFFQYSGC
ncbi:hypothetical protein R1sor_016272 [Riccia sorocarpa]|uniref:non-specific serine/threonine protein kinase n=1 Tax=Riccia sorocarpa TaxID=122646 RepID=A0ABD3HEY6_9MARC